MEDVKKVIDLIKSAETILIGAGAGLSTAAGYTYSGERFKKYFADFESKYGFHDMYSGGFYPYETEEEFWAFWSRYIMCNRYDQSASETHLNLLKLVDGKNYFVLTTNVDHVFQNNGFDKQRLFYTQGDYGLLQCATPCHNKTYDNEDIIRKMAAEQKNMRIPSNLIPKCPKCGGKMTLNLRSDDKFVEDEGWHQAAYRYKKFLIKYADKPIIFLELGVGGNTPGIIKYPFWRMTADNPHAVYICVNQGEAFAPEDIADQSIIVNMNISDFLSNV